MLICYALTMLFAPVVVAASSVLSRINVAGLPIDLTDQEGQRIARTLQNEITYKAPDWNKVTQPLLAKRDEEIRAEEQRRAETERQKKVVTVQKTTPVVAPRLPVQTSSHADWLRAAGIPENQWGNVDFIVSRESGWNPNAVNKSSGACGLGQQLPCGKWAGTWNDPVAALVAMNGYVNRYGGWAGAVAFWQSHNWY